MKQKNNIIQGALKILLGSRQKQFRELAAKWLFEGSREHGTPHAEAHLCYQILRPHVHYTPIANKQAFWHFMMSHGAVSLQMYIHFLTCRKLCIHIDFGKFLIIQTAFLLAMGV